MLGGYEAPGKEELINGIINRQRKELGKEALPTSTSTSSKGLEKPNTTGDQSAKGMGPEVPKGHGDNKQDEPGLAAHTSVQTGLNGFDVKPQQIQAFTEFDGNGKKETLIDVEKIKEQEANKPLPGQIDFLTGKTVEGKDVTISDVTPKGYGIEEGGITVTPKIEKIKGETTDEATAREVGYQIDNGRVKLSESVDGWKATVISVTDEKPHVIKAFKKQDVLNETWKYLNPDYTETKKSETPKPQTAAAIPEKKLTELRAINAQRKPASIVRDNKAQNKITITHNDPHTKTWEKHPGSMDVLGVDTPNFVTRASHVPKFKTPQPKQNTRPKSVRHKRHYNGLIHHTK